MSPQFRVTLTKEEVEELQKISSTVSCPKKSSYVPVCQLVKGIYLFK